MRKISLIRQEGGSRVMTVSSVLPKEWTVVEVTIHKQTKDCVMLKIDRIK